MNPLLKTENLTKYFGGVKALDGVDMEVRGGIIQSVIGPNGAGKTTFFNVVSGVFRPSGGEITFDGERITGSQSHRIASRGLTRTFQNLQLFSDMTVIENVMVGMHLRSKSGIFSSALKLPSAIREERVIRERSMDWLRFVGLEEQHEKIASGLPFGNQRLLELARALASEPRLLMLDEPAAGLNNRETQDLSELIVRIKKENITVLLVEHDMDLVMEVSEHIMVMDQGKVIAEGDPEAIRKNEKVLKAYLGVE